VPSDHRLREAIQKQHRKKNWIALLQGLRAMTNVTSVSVDLAVKRRPNFMARKSTRKAVLIWSFLAPSLLIFLLYRILPLAWNR
jgi:hypothetical protein